MTRKWVEFMLDDVLLEAGDKWRVWCDASGFAEEEFRKALCLRQKADRSIRAERYVQLNSFEECCRWRYRDNSADNQWK